jgi:hypothetical protein
MTDVTLPELPEPAKREMFMTNPPKLGMAWFTADQMRAYAVSAALMERERCAKLADLHDLEWIARRIREVHERTVPRQIQGTWFWSERDDTSEWQHYRASEPPEWAAAIRSQEAHIDG